MTITIELESEIETHVKEQAGRSGLPLEEYIVSIINEAVSKLEQNGTDVSTQLDEIYAVQPSVIDMNLQKMQALSVPPEDW